MQDARLCRTTLRDTLLTKAMHAIWSVAVSRTGTFWATGNRQEASGAGARRVASYISVGRWRDASFPRLAIFLPCEVKISHRRPG
jgi:hypothetical protein